MKTLSHMSNLEDLFPDVRESGDTPLRQCQLVMLRMLKIFDMLCLKHGVKYFLTGGSLIGAVRHNGFIPWDDDLDVGMTRSNYELFISKVVPELPNDMFFQSDLTDKYYPAGDFVEARLRDKYSSYKHLDQPNNKWQEGFQIDLFIYDKAFLPNNFLIICQNMLLSLFGSNKTRSNILKWIEKKTPFTLVYASSYLKNFGMLNLGTYITAQEYSHLIRHKFEDTESYIPVGWDSYLRRQYGDYMLMPPEGKRIANHKVKPEPFTPCNHTQILFWEDRGEFRKSKGWQAKTQ